MSTQNKAFFFTAVPNTDRFLSGDEPTEAVMKDFADSVAFKLESSDTATETQQGLVETATQAEYDGGIDTNGIGYSLYVRPSMIKAAISIVTTAIQTQIDAILNDIVNINNAITTIQTDITTIQGDITTIQNEIITIEGEVADSMPIGAIILYPINTAPSASWLLCDGQSVATGDYPDLFTVIGYSFGGGAGLMQLPDTRQKFIAGYDQLGAPDYNTIGSGAGANDVLLTGAESGVQLHTHDLGASATSAGSTTTDGAHTHMCVQAAVTESAASIGWTCASNGDYKGGVLLDSGGYVPDDGTNCSGIYQITSSFYNPGNHNHNLTTTLSGSTESTEGGIPLSKDATDPHENRPEFIVFPYFIKAK